MMIPPLLTKKKNNVPKSAYYPLTIKENIRKHSYCLIFIKKHWKYKQEPKSGHMQGSGKVGRVERTGGSRSQSTVPCTTAVGRCTL